MRTITCPHCVGHGKTRTDDDLDRDLRWVLDIACKTPPGSDPEASTTAGLAWKLGETEDRVVASFERLATRPGAGIVKKVPPSDSAQRTADHPWEDEARAAGWTPPAPDRRRP